MYCGNCGSENPSNAVFCQNCGAKLGVGTNCGNETNNRGYSDTQCAEPQFGGAENRAAVKPNMAELIKAATSKSFLTGVIALTVSIGISTLVGMVTTMGISTFTNILPILELVSLWLIYSSAKKGTLNQGAVNIIKVVEIINLVLICLVTFVCIAFIVLSNAITPIVLSELTPYVEEYTSLMPVDVSLITEALLILISVLAVFVCAVEIVCKALILQCINGVSATATDDAPLKKCSGYIKWTLYSLGVCAVLGGVLTLNLSGIAEGISSFSFGRVISQFNKAADELNGSQNNNYYTSAN